MFDGREGLLEIERADAVRWVGPRDAGVQVLHDLPLRKDALHLLGVFELKRLEEEAGRFEGWGHEGRTDSRLAECQLLKAASRMCWLWTPSVPGPRNCSSPRNAWAKLSIMRV